MTTRCENLHGQKQCEVCGKFFSEKERKRSTACSRECIKARRRRRLREKRQIPLGTPKKCAVCGKIFLLKSASQKYCGSKCAYTAKSIRNNVARKAQPLVLPSRLRSFEKSLSFDEMSTGNTEFCCWDCPENDPLQTRYTASLEEIWKISVHNTTLSRGTGEKCFSSEAANA